MEVQSLSYDNYQFVEQTRPLPSPKKAPSVTQEVSSIESMILATFGTYDAVRVAKCESGLKATVVNNNPRTGDYSVGLFQINLHGKLAKNRPSEEWLKVPQNNISYAYQMFKKRGWSDWTCATKLGIG